MKENRGIHILLILVKVELEKMQLGPYLGLCFIIIHLHLKKQITSNERNELLDYVKNNRPSKFSSWSAFLYRKKMHYWKPGKCKHRIKWLNSHIKKTFKEINNN